ncbi:MAG: 23S rRNA (adenine(2503)-C(2))-methyltransferase RlmN [Deltaproteobacteria bacterium]|nr:23S rRNA (adenine(2503)-C(2))-methyltransferase RlmN [Deltaproteobacteria bacterium]
MMASVHLLDLDLPGLEGFFQGFGERPFRARQVMHWLYKRGVTDFEAMTDLGRAVRQELGRRARLDLPAIAAEQVSVDGTRKLLVELGDGERVETVLIPDEDRLTQCVSSQVGCAMACAFCRTGASGLRRNLTAGEIVGQVVLGQSLVPPGSRVTNVVFMGMGEPLHNLENVVRAFRILSSDDGLNITRRRLTVSTCGLADAVRRLPADVLPSLAVSLNATTDEVRSRIMPVNRRHPIAELLGVLRDRPLPPRCRYTIEYVLLGGVNDSLEDARRLVRLLSKLRCKVNLIPYNPHRESAFAAPEPERVEAFQQHLLGKGFTTVVRKSRGQDILAACGQLGAEEARPRSCPSMGPRDTPHPGDNARRLGG